MWGHCSEQVGVNKISKNMKGWKMIKNPECMKAWMSNGMFYRRSKCDDIEWYGNVNRMNKELLSNIFIAWSLADRETKGDPKFIWKKTILVWVIGVIGVE